jgi:3-phosphoshikimate 1-carboxyvinyltransferase
MPAKITLKGSKSITNRALLLAYLTKLQTGKPTKLKNIGECDDTSHMQQGLKKLATKSPGKIHLGNAGTAVRFLTALATVSNKDVTITGCKRMKERPIKPLTETLNRLGAKITTSSSGCLPLHIKTSTLKGGTVQIPGNISSQYISALLMTAPLMVEKGLKLHLTGEVFSKPYIEMTIKLMKKFGIKVEKTSSFKTLKVAPNQKFKNPVDNKLFIEGDASSASYLGAYAALKPETLVTIAGIPQKSIQGDIAFTSYLRKMGCKVTHTNTEITIQGPKTLKPLGEIDMNKTPDLVMTFAVLSAFANGITKITNIANLRIKESDRISVLKNEFTKLGIKVKAGKDYIEIKGNPSLTLQHKRTTIKTYNDHRIAMAFGVLKKTVLPRLRIEKPSVVRKSYPEFWSDLNLLNRN